MQLCNVYALRTIPGPRVTNRNGPMTIQQWILVYLL